MKTVIGVFYGGKTVEHEVSIISALQVINAIDKEVYEVVPIYISKDNEFYYSKELLDVKLYSDIDKLKNKCEKVYFTHENNQMIVNSFKRKFNKTIFKIDVAFPVVHGLNVEDGTLQGFLEMYNIAYVGCDVCSSAVGMNKTIFKKVLLASNIPVIDYYELVSVDYFTNEEKIYNEVEAKLDMPVIIKPNNLGSSIGIKIANNLEEFKEAVESAFEFCDRILIEKCIEDLKEINSSVIGNYESQEVSVLEEPIKSDEILSYEDKYMSENPKTSKISGMDSLTRKIPAELSYEMEKEIHKISKEVFKILNLEGVCRIDYIIDNKENKLYVNEVNTIPGSISFYLWEPKDVKFDILCDRLIKLALKRQSKRRNIVYSTNVNILNMHAKK